MKYIRIINNYIIILIMILMLYFFGTDNIAAQGPSSPKVIGGRVYTSEGVSPNDGFEGTYAAVILEHEGIKTIHIDPNGMEQDDYGGYWYFVTIPEGYWDINDTYWVEVDATGWGDLNYTCVDHNNPDINSWKIGGIESELRDVNTVNETIVDNGEVTPPYLFLVGISIIAAVILILAIVILRQNKKTLKPPF